MGRERAECLGVVISSPRERRVCILADADAAHTRVAAGTQVRGNVVGAPVVEAHAIDQRAGAPQSEKARAWIARLRARCHGTDFDVTEAERAQRIEIVGVLVESRRESDWMCESQAKKGAREFRRDLWSAPYRLHPPQAREREAMRELRVEPLQCG
jgi:hypothetical protein